MVIVYVYVYRLSSTVRECHTFSSLLLGTDWGQSLLLICDTRYQVLYYRSFAVTINSCSRCCSHMHGPLPLPSTSLNHKASCISMSPVLPPTVFTNSSSRYLMLSCCLQALRHYACGLHIQTERWVARSCANPCLWRHDSDGRHRDASGEGVFSKVHGRGTNVVEALPWHSYSFPGPGPVGRPPPTPLRRTWWV